MIGLLKKSVAKLMYDLGADPHRIHPDDQLALDHEQEKLDIENNKRKHQEKRAMHIYNTTGRNDPCPCGSGKKFKKCHLR